MAGFELFNEAIKRNLIDNRKYLKGRHHYIPAYMKVVHQLEKQQKIRNKIKRQEHLTVPPLMIISVTNDCNLRCEGCYANAQEREKKLEMSKENLETLVQDGIDLGVGIFLIAGGEPLMKEGLLDIVKQHKTTIFVMFTNGLLISEGLKNQMKAMKHVVPIFSLEGSQATTDKRRGKGIYNKVMEKMTLLDANKMLFGTSITLTRQNYDEVMNDLYIENLEQKGCRILFLIEYVPCSGDKSLCLSGAQKEDLLIKIKDIQKVFSILPIPLPGDEAHFQGCLAAGRGFIHISSTGALEACPFAPYSDVSILDMPLKEALKSRLLTQIRLHHHRLEGGEGGCALFENPQWVRGLIKEGEMDRYKK